MELQDNETILTSGAASSMQGIRLSQNEDKSINITFIEDKSNGYRSFQIDSKDWENFKHVINTK